MLGTVEIQKHLRDPFLNFKNCYMIPCVIYTMT